MKYTNSKHQKDFLKDLKRVYAAQNRNVRNWTVWKRNWESSIQSLSNHGVTNGITSHTIFSIQNPFVGLFIPPILWKGIIARKVTKAKGVFPNDDVLMKLVHLSVILFERSDHAIDKLRTKCIAIGHKVWRSIQYYVTFLPGRLLIQKARLKIVSLR